MNAHPRAHRPIEAAVVTGRHPFDVRGFHRLFRTLPGIEYYPQHMEDFAAASDAERLSYDAVVFYNFHQELPEDGAPWYEQGTHSALQKLGDTDQGIFVLHHALAAYPHWTVWSDIVGLRNRASLTPYAEQSLRIEVAGSDHPITHGLTSWTMTDETYVMDDSIEEGQVLLTTRHERSMRNLAWAREYRNARVFCLQSGHDNHAFSNLHFRTVVARGLQWCARRLP